MKLQLRSALVVMTLECTVVPGACGGLFPKFVHTWLLDSVSVCKHIYLAGCSSFPMTVSYGTKTSLCTEIPSRLNSSVLNSS